MDNYPLSSINVRFGDLAFNLLAGESGEPLNLEKAVHFAFWPDICAAFSMDSIQASNLLFIQSNISMDKSAACIMVCSIMTDDSKLPSLTVSLACDEVSGLLAVMLEVWKI